MAHASFQTPRQFLSEIDQLKNDALSDFANGEFGRLSFGDPSRPPQERPEILALLKAMVYPERIAGDILAARIASIPDIDLKERVAEQAAEEFIHLEIIREMLSSWGEDPDEMWRNPLPELVQVFDYVRQLETLAEFFTANFIGESLLLSANLQVMRELAPEVFNRYLDVSIPDEAKHIQINRDAIVRYCTNAELQAKARVVARKLLQSFVAGYKAKLRLMTELSSPLAGAATNLAH